MAEFDVARFGPRERAQFLTALVAPRPIAFVSTVSGTGVGNLSPFSFFMAAGYNPLSVAFSPVRLRTGAEKDSVRNVRETGEFVVNIATHAMLAKLNQASFDYPPDVDEFDAAGFTRAPSTVVKPPRVAEAAASLECRLFRIVPHGTGPSSGTYIIGEVVHIHVSDEVLTAGIPDNRKIEHVARLGADAYARIAPELLFDLKRPAAP